MSVVNVLAYGSTIVSSGVARIDDNTFLSSSTKNVWINLFLNV